MTTDKLIEQIKADREAGTPGPWRLGSWGDDIFGTGPKDDWLFICRVERDDMSLDESKDGFDARRIARVTDMEARILADAEVIEALEAEMERMRGALEFYADENRFGLPSEGPWGVGSVDFGKKARATLAQIDAEPAEPRHPTVKPLGWDWTDGYGLICKADTPVGTYSIHQDGDSAAGALLMYLHLTEDGDCTRYAIEWREYLEPEEMQAIAQADYERRFLSALAEQEKDDE